MATLQPLLQVVGTGIGATIIMDLWLVILQEFGAAPVNFDMVGRWVGHWLRGRLWHASIRESPRISGERTLGWLTHYSVGITFAGLLAAVQGPDWMQHPSPGPAIAIGMATVLAPLFIMQPAMGSGFASTRTPTPLKNCLRSLANHTVFGFGLYAAARLIAAIS
jgi:hypothetical protein